MSSGTYDRTVANLSVAEAELQGWLNGLLQRLSPAKQERLLRRLAFEMRKRMSKRVDSQQNPDGSAYQARKPRGSNKGKMFRKLGRLMQVDSAGDRAAVGYPGGFRAFLAGVHQFGDTVPVNKKGTTYAFPVRALLGFSDEDRADIEQIVFDMVNNG